jgi:hypothetical protein
MNSPPRTRSAAPASQLSLSRRAFDDLRTIRATMERAVSFTAVPGWGGVLMGLTALVATPFAMRAETRTHWLVIWFSAAAVAAVFGVIDMRRKAQAENSALFSAAGSRFALALGPGFFAGAVLTLVALRIQKPELLPGLWLLLYGVAVAAAGAYSMRAVRWMGLCFMLIGLVALAGPIEWSDPCMAMGFGCLHIITGAHIARHKRG